MSLDNSSISTCSTHECLGVADSVSTIRGCSPHADRPGVARNPTFPDFAFVNVVSGPIFPVSGRSFDDAIERGKFT